tara:strand:- start:56 stop:466 length:411 start_codon:yes stop_codon:yes gene_type:complete
MKKVFFTIALTCATLISSAQFTVVSQVNSPADGDSWELSNFTNNMGVGYSLNGETMIGAVKDGDDYNVFARKDMGMGFICLEAPTEDMIENMNIGWGMYINIYKGLSANPMYMIPLNEDANGERNGNLSLGLSYNL